MSHTPGPWKWDSKPWDYDREQEAPWLVSENDPYTCLLVVYNGHTVSEDDAQLIAAAPDLLRDLRAIVDNAILLGIDHDERVIAAKATVAKAEGCEA